MFVEFVMEMEQLVWDVMEFHLVLKKIVAESVVEMDHLASSIATFLKLAVHAQKL